MVDDWLCWILITSVFPPALQLLLNYFFLTLLLFFGDFFFICEEIFKSLNASEKEWYIQHCI